MMYTTKDKGRKEGGERKRRWNSNNKKKSVAAVGHARGERLRAVLSLAPTHQTKQAHTPHTRRHVPLVTASVTRAISFSSSLEGAVAVAAAIRSGEWRGEVASSSRTKSEDYRQTEAGVKRVLGCCSLWVTCVTKGGMRRGRVSMGYANFGC